MLALNELRLVLRLAQAYGAAERVRERLPELAATLGAGFGLRALARELLGLSPGRRLGAQGRGRVRRDPRASAKPRALRFELAPTRRPAGAARAAP